MSMIVALVLAYLLGSMNAGYYLVRSRTGQDLRQLGSGNAGAKNAGRILGRGGFALVFIADALKGAMAVWIAAALDTGMPGMALAMLAAVLGHVFPVQLGFRGGKGASTALGALLALDMMVAVAALLVCAILYLASRRAVESGLVTFALLPALALVLQRALPEVLALAALSILVLAAHRSNLAAWVRASRRTLSRNNTG